MLVMSGWGGGGCFDQEIKPQAQMQQQQQEERYAAPACAAFSTGQKTRAARPNGVVYEPVLNMDVKGPVKTRRVLCALLVRVIRDTALSGIATNLCACSSGPYSSLTLRVMLSQALIVSYFTLPTFRPAPR